MFFFLPFLVSLTEQYHKKPSDKKENNRKMWYKGKGGDKR